MSLKGNVSSLANLSAKLRQLPRVVAQKVAAASAAALTEIAQGTFDAGEDPYGNTWAPGAEGQRVTLEKSGSLERGLRYVAIGTKLRVALPVKYAKYQVGKRQVFPRAGAALPTDYAKTLEQVSRDTLEAELKGAT